MTSSARRVVLASGRWDPELAVIDLDLVLDPTNRGAWAAVISRPRVTPDIRTAAGVEPACGLPVSVLAAPDLNRIFVVNHAGNASAEEAARMPHGHRGTVAVLDLAKAIDPAHSDTTDALIDVVDLGVCGPVGCALTEAGHLLVSSAEGNGTEDGGHCIIVVDAASGRVVVRTKLRHDGPPAEFASPHASFGRYPNPNGVAISERAGLVFAANGGTNDISVLSLGALLDGRDPVEIGRVPVSSGPLGLALSPDGAWLASADREDARTGCEGNRISLIDAVRAGRDPHTAATASVQVGTDDFDRPSRPAGVAFAPDGRSLYVTCTGTGTLSRVDVERALAGEPCETHRIQVPGGAPRGVRVTTDGRHVVAAGGQRGSRRSGTFSAFRADNLVPAGTVAGVGNEPYFFDIFNF